MLHLEIKNEPQTHCHPPVADSYSQLRAFGLWEDKPLPFLGNYGVFSDNCICCIPQAEREGKAGKAITIISRVVFLLAHIFCALKAQNLCKTDDIYKC